MYKNLETYLEEIGHFLSDPAEREEILNEIRSHIMEKAEQEGNPATEALLEKVIAAYGKPRRVAEKYLDGQPVIAAFTRHLFRYASLLFAVHLAFTVFAVIFKKSFIVFPFLFMPRLGIIEAFMYLPMAFLADFGFIALVLFFITRSGRDIKLPWPKFALDLEEVRASDAKTLASRIATMVGVGIMLALTGLAVKLFIKFQTIFLVSFNSEKFRPLLLPGPGRQVSLIVIAMFAAGTIGLFVKLFSLSRRLTYWVDAVTDGISLILIGMLLRQPYAGLFAVQLSPVLLSWIRLTLIITLLITALIIAIDLVVNIVRLGRKYMFK
jgi:hypothetical protein